MPILTQNSLLHSEYLLMAIHLMDGVDYLVNILLTYLQWLKHMRFFNWVPHTCSHSVIYVLSHMYLGSSLPAYRSWNRISLIIGFLALIPQYLCHSETVWLTSIYPESVISRHKERWRLPHKLFKAITSGGTLLPFSVSLWKWDVMTSHFLPRRQPSRCLGECFVEYFKPPNLGPVITNSSITQAHQTSPMRRSCWRWGSWGSDS